MRVCTELWETSVQILSSVPNKIKKTQRKSPQHRTRKAQEARNAKQHHFAYTLHQLFCTKFLPVSFGRSHCADGTIVSDKQDIVDDLFLWCLF